MGSLDPLRHHEKHQKLQGAFGTDRFGMAAEKFARFFGTPKFIIGQTVIVLLWIGFNAYVLAHFLSHHAFDPYPFILLNLLFSTQAAYAAPLILLAQTRQADRDKASEIASAKHRQEESDRQVALLNENTDITRQNYDISCRQMIILGKVENVHDDLAALTRALQENGVIDGRPGSNQGLDSGTGSG